MYINGAVWQDGRGEPILPFNDTKTMIMIIDIVRLLIGTEI